MRATNTVVTRKRRKKWLKRAEGTFGINHKSYRNAKQSVLKSAKYAYRDRKNKKREFRRLWILRINAALKELNYTYSSFIAHLKASEMVINRKMLSELAISNPEIFATLAKKVMSTKITPKKEVKSEEKKVAAKSKSVKAKVPSSKTK